jgi:O-antigen ligase
LKEYLKTYSQFILIGIVWLIVGIYLGPTIYIFLPAMLLLMFHKEMHLEILLGFFLILTLSDSRSHALHFAGGVKNIYIVLLFLFSLKIKNVFLLPIKLYLYFIPFFAIAFLCLLYSPIPLLSFQKLLSYVFLTVAVPIYFQFVYRHYGTKLFKGIVFFACIIFFLGILFWLIGFDIVYLGGRYRGLLGNPNGLGLFLLLFTILFVFMDDKFEGLFSRKEKFWVYGLIVVSMLKSGSRTALFAILIFLFFKKFYKISPWIGFIIFLISLFLYQLISDNLVSIITSLGLEEELRVDTINNGSGRLVAWNFAWQEIQKNFFIGKGLSYTDYLFKQNADYLSVLGHQGHAHNSYLTFWLDTGLVGLIVFLSGLLALFLKAAKNNQLAIPLLYAILFSNNFESWLTASLNPFTIQLLFILSVVFLEKKQEETILTTSAL